MGDFAAKEGIPRAYLARLAMELRAAGLVHSRRGAKGGYLLARPADRILLYDVVSAVEGRLSGAACLEGSGRCQRAAECGARSLWKGMSDVLEGFLKQRTLADLAGVASQGT